MNILITGASGFVGSNVAAYLFENGYTLAALDLEKGIENTHYSFFYTWDELNNINFDSFDAIIHLAGKAHDTKNKSGAKVYFDINTGLTQLVFDRFMQSKATKFIFFSSVKAAADSVENGILTEDIVPHPIGPYGESKIKAEEYIQSINWGDKLVYIFRPCMIHGPGNKGNLNLLYKVVSKGIPYPLGAFDNARSFLSIWNLSWIIGQFMQKNIESGIYNVADDEPVSTNTLIKLIADSVGRKAQIWKWNKKIVEKVAQWGGICRLPLNADRLKKLTENYVISNHKIKTALKISRLPEDSISGLRRTLKTFHH